jgi:hypothetical protein
MAAAGCMKKVFSATIKFLLSALAAPGFVIPYFRNGLRMGNHYYYHDIIYCYNYYILCILERLLSEDGFVLDHLDTNVADWDHLLASMQQLYTEGRFAAMST